MNTVVRVSIAMLSVAFAAPAFASQICQRLADEKQLVKASRASFIKKCRADQHSDPVVVCQRVAVQRNLQGADRNASVKGCVVNESPRRK
jgi:hypothetical protein